MARYITNVEDTGHLLGEIQFILWLKQKCKSLTKPTKLKWKKKKWITLYKQVTLVEKPNQNHNVSSFRRVHFLEFFQFWHKINNYKKHINRIVTSSRPDYYLILDHYRKKSDKHTNFSTSLYAHGFFLHPPCTFILNFSTMVQLTLSFLDLQVYMRN